MELTWRRESTDRRELGIDVERVVISRQPVQGCLFECGFLLNDSVRLPTRRVVGGSSRSSVYLSVECLWGLGSRRKLT